jgi:hypothetical protein
LPVDDEINLNDPEGITQEDLDIMNREADELEELAKGAERNAEKIKKATDSLKGMDFATKNIIQSEVEGKPTDMGAVDINTRLSLLEKQLMEVAIISQGQKKTDQEHDMNIEEARKHRVSIDEKIEHGFSEVDKDLKLFMNASSSPFQFAKGRLMGFIGKAGPYGAIAMTIYSVAQTLWDEYMKSFKAGGANDIRKLMDDRDKEMAEMDDILNRRNGTVFFTAETTLKQTSPYSSNTSLMADQVLRYQALHLGE